MLANSVTLLFSKTGRLPSCNTSPPFYCVWLHGQIPGGVGVHRFAPVYGGKLPEISHVSEWGSTLPFHRPRHLTISPRAGKFEVLHAELASTAGDVIERPPQEPNCYTASLEEAPPELCQVHHLFRLRRGSRLGCLPRESGYRRHSMLKWPALTQSVHAPAAQRALSIR